MGLSYEKSGDTITIIVQDPTYRKTGQWKFNTADKELANGIFRHIQRKYGFTPEVKPAESVGEKNKVDKSWLDLDVNW